jgi:hypothetical protein
MEKKENTLIFLSATPGQNLLTQKNFSQRALTQEKREKTITMPITMLIRLNTLQHYSKKKY